MFVLFLLCVGKERERRIRRLVQVAPPRRPQLQLCRLIKGAKRLYVVHRANKVSSNSIPIPAWIRVATITALGLSRSLHRLRLLRRRPILTPRPASLLWVKLMTDNFFLFQIINRIMCFIRFVASFVESTSTSIEWPIVQRIPLTPSASDQNNTSQNPNCSRATPGVAAHTSGGGLKSNQASCTYSHYAALGYTTTDQLLPCHFGGTDNT